MQVMTTPVLAGRRQVAPSPSLGGSRRQDVPALTGLRFVAAFSVLLAHGVSTILASHETTLGVVYWLRQASGFGMTLFFVLSGFVIHYNYAALVTEGRFRGIAAYLWARFARLYPLFLLMMLVYVLMNSRHPERFGGIARALPYFLMSVQSWFYVPIEGNSLIYAISGASRMLASRPAIVLGDASYSIYLLHYVVLMVVFKLTGSTVHGVVFDTVKLILVMTAILLISILLYAYYEAPARKWLRQRGGKRSSLAALAKAPQSSAS